MLRFNGLWNTILTLECRAQEIPLVFQAEEDYESGLGKKKIWSLVIIKGGKGEGGRGGGGRGGRGNGEGEGVEVEGCQSCCYKIY